MYTDKVSKIETTYNVKIPEQCDIRQFTETVDGAYLDIVRRSKLEEYVKLNIKYPRIYERQQIVKKFYAHGYPVVPVQILKIITAFVYLIFTYVNQKPLKYVQRILSEISNNVETVHQYRRWMCGKNVGFYSLKNDVLKSSTRINDPLDYMLKVYLIDLVDTTFNDVDKVVIMAIIFTQRRRLLSK